MSLENKIAKLTKINQLHSDLMPKNSDIENKKNLTNKFINELLALYDYIETQQDLDTPEIERARHQFKAWSFSCLININMDLAMSTFLVQNKDPGWIRLSQIVNQPSEDKKVVEQSNLQSGLYKHLAQVWNDTIHLKLASFNSSDNKNFSDWLKTISHIPHDVIAVTGFAARSIVQALFYTLRHPSSLILKNLDDADGGLNDIQYFLKEVGMGVDNFLRRPPELVQSLVDMSENNLLARVTAAALSTLKATYNSNDRWSDFSQYIQTTFANKWAELKKEFKDKPIRCSTEFLLWAITFVTIAVRHFPKKPAVPSAVNSGLATPSAGAPPSAAAPPPPPPAFNPILQSISKKISYPSLDDCNLNFETIKSFTKPSHISPEVVSLLKKTGNIQAPTMMRSIYPQTMTNSAISPLTTAASNSNISLNHMNISATAGNGVSTNTIATALGTSTVEIIPAASTSVSANIIATAVTATSAGLTQSDIQEKINLLSLQKEILSIYTLPSEVAERSAIIDEIIETENEFNINTNFIDEQQNLVETNQENIQIYDEDEDNEIMALKNEISILKTNIDYYNVHKIKQQPYLKNSLLTKYQEDVVNQNKNNAKTLTETQVLTQEPTVLSTITHKQLVKK